MPQDRGPDRTFIRDGAFHRAIANVRNQVWTETKMSALSKANEPGVREQGDVFAHVKPEEDPVFSDEDIESIAFYDGLEGCYNLRYLVRKLVHELKRSKRYNRPTALVMVGIDGFDRIEPEYGELAADKVVFTVIEFLLGVVRTDIDMVGRLSDDRYILVLPETPGKGAAIMAERTRLLFNNTIELKHNWHRLPITLSFGITYFPGHGEDSKELIARADLACEFVQSRGGDGFAFAPEQ
ncbi:MAG: GGDEF domain-containing protein [Cyanobacteria bacterium SZAS LIN-2]|nr:GGDEF domain-containing protein [Cyanobacteria bacterium SZAS LIN-2]